jgi:hypothetical protein
VLSPLFYVFSFVACLFVLKAIFANQFANRIESLRALFGYMPVILWTAPWLLIVLFQKSKLKMLIGSIPYLVILLCSIMVVTRSWLILTLMIPPMLMIVSKRSIENNYFQSRLLIYPAILLLLLATIGWYFFGSQITAAFDMLQARLFEDTRSGQYTEFLSQVSIVDLLIGKGPKGTWIWAGKEYASIDGSYTLLLFNGGLPLLWAYFVLMIRPALKVMQTRAPAADLLAASVLCIWGVALTGVSIYSVPDISLSHNILCLFAGRCLGYLSERDFSILADSHF